MITRKNKMLLMLTLNCVALILCAGLLAACGVDTHTCDWGGDTLIAPTCTAEGYTKQTCDCGEERVKPDSTVAINPANHAGTQVVRTAATCTATGINEWNCCQADGDTLPINAANHTGTQVVRTAATCTATGINEWNCCQADGDTLPTNPANHSGTQVVRTAATCTATGINEWDCCQADGDIINIDPAAHNMDWVVTTPVTETTDGIETYKCTRVGCTHTDGTRIYATAGLEYTPINGTAYSVSGGTASGDIIIPAYHNGLPVTEIASAAFTGNTAITSVFISANVTIIRGATVLPGSILSGGAFRGATNLVSVVFAPNSQLTTIEQYAFDACSSLRTVMIPSSVTSIGDGAFRATNALRAVFYGVATFTEWQAIDINNGGNRNHTFIERTRFFYSETLHCEGWRFVDGLPTAYVTLGLVFTLIDSNTALSVARGTATGDIIIPSVRNGLPVTEIATNGFTGTATTSVFIPSTVTRINSRAFQSATALTSVTFAPNSTLTTIGGGTGALDGAFDGARALTSIVIPASVTTIEQNAFRDTRALTSVTFAPNSSLLSIGIAAFRRSGISSIVIPASVTTVNNFAFANMPNLVSVVFAKGSQLHQINGDVFFGSVELDNIVIPLTVRTIHGDAFGFCNKIMTIYYGGNQDDWGGISITQFGNDRIRFNDVTRLFYSETEPTENPQNFWRWVEGVPTAWAQI